MTTSSLSQTGLDRLHRALDAIAPAQVAGFLWNGGLAEFRDLAAHA